MGSLQFFASEKTDSDDSYNSISIIVVLIPLFPPTLIKLDLAPTISVPYPWTSVIKKQDNQANFFIKSAADVAQNAFSKFDNRTPVSVNWYLFCLGIL